VYLKPQRLGGEIRMDIPPFMISSLAFSLYITCPRMTAMIASQAKIAGVNPMIMISLGSIIGIPFFALLFYALQSYGVGAAVLLAAALDVGAALLVGNLDLRAGIELAIITIFVYAGMRIAPLIAKLLTP
jgi:hypothetical protein